MTTWLLPLILLFAQESEQARETAAKSDTGTAQESAEQQVGEPEHAVQEGDAGTDNAEPDPEPEIGDEQASAPSITPELFDAFRWRELGPTTMGGRITDIAVHPERSRIFYVASASGGLFRTRNQGVDFEPVFENGGVGSVGAVAISAADPDLLWIGTGEANARNSVSWGDGVYRSDDGGDRWTHVGLEHTFHVGAIAADPMNADIAFVAATGSTWGPSEQRGLFRTCDRGATWEHVLAIDEHTGCIDVVIDPVDPRIVYAATYERQRDEFDGNNVAKATGPGSGIWRSTDGGQSFDRMTNGLPSVAMGRIGLSLYEKDPRVLWAIIETERTGERGAPNRSEDQVSLGIRGLTAETGGFVIQSVTEGESAAQAGLAENDVITRVGETETPDRETLVAALREFSPGAEVEVAYLRAEQAETTTLRFLGKILERGGRSFAGSQGGQVANAQGQQGDDGFETGGVFRSEDRGETWTRVNSLNPRPFYYSQIRVDPTDESVVYVLGINAHRSTDRGENFRTDIAGNAVHPDHHALWIDPENSEHLLLGNDGGMYETWDACRTWRFLGSLPIAQFYNVCVDMSLPYRVFGGLQDNGSWGGPSATRGRGIVAADWFKIGGGDGFHTAADPDDPDLVYSESQNGNITRWNLRTGEQDRVRRPRGNYRFNWNTPFFLSPHNSKILFHAGNVVFRSLDRGTSSQVISPEIGRTDRGTATAFAQSPLDPDVLFVGTDDGALWRTTDGGREWTSIVEALPELGGPRYISDIECSKHSRDRVYVTVDGHRSDDYAPHAFVSEDLGDSFARIVGGLPENYPVRTIVEDAVNESLLFCGTETGCYLSLSRGEHWTRFTSGLPTVPVHDLVLHPRDHELVAATHGRGIWVVDIAPLQEMRPVDFTPEARPLFFATKPVHLWMREPQSEGWGTQGFVARNPQRGVALWVYLPQTVDEELKLVVRSSLGRDLRELDCPNEAGIHRIVWDLRAGRRGGGGPGGGGFGGAGFGGGGGEAGDYAVELVVGGETLTQGIRVLPDPLQAEVGARFAR